MNPTLIRVKCRIFCLFWKTFSCLIQEVKYEVTGHIARLLRNLHNKIPWHILVKIPGKIHHMDGKDIIWDSFKTKFVIRNIKPILWGKERHLPIIPRHFRYFPWNFQVFSDLSILALLSDLQEKGIFFEQQSLKNEYFLNENRILFFEYN